MIILILIWLVVNISIVTPIDTRDFEAIGRIVWSDGEVTGYWKVP